MTSGRGMAAITEGRVAPYGKAKIFLACFGVLCLRHHRCARYAAVVSSQANPNTLGTCLSGSAYPMFVEAVGSSTANAAGESQTPSIFSEVS